MKYEREHVHKMVLKAGLVVGICLIFLVAFGFFAKPEGSAELRPFFPLAAFLSAINVTVCAIKLRNLPRNGA